MSDIGLTFGEPHGEGEVEVTAVLVRGQEIGNLTGMGTHMFTWIPGDGAAQLGLQIESMTSWQREVLIETLTVVIERQLRRLAEGQPLSASDIDVLDSELRAYTSIRVFGEVLQHPLVYAVPYTAAMAPNYNRTLKLKKAKLDEARAEGNWRQYIFWHERPYRLQAFFDIIANLTDKDYWSLIGNFWTDSENIHQNLPDWKQLWSAKLPNRDHAMDDDERAALAKLPEIVTVYRGFQHKASMRGMSWTLDRNKAIWFANRYGRGSGKYLATAQVRKERILAHFLGRQEHEIVVLPKDLKQVVFEKLLSKSF